MSQDEPKGVCCEFPKNHPCHGDFNDGISVHIFEPIAPDKPTPGQIGLVDGDKLLDWLESKVWSCRDTQEKHGWNDAVWTLNRLVRDGKFKPARGKDPFYCPGPIKRGSNTPAPTQPEKCPNCGRTDCTSGDSTGLCGAGEFFDPENTALKCQHINLAPTQPSSG